MATNKDLEKEIEDGKFKRDLYFRIRVVAITIPPLRDRLEDLPHLIDAIREKLREDYSILSVPYFDEDQMEKMKSYSWPGNIRELRTLMEVMTTVGPDEFNHHPVAHQQDDDGAAPPRSRAGR